MKKLVITATLAFISSLAVAGDLDGRYELTKKVQGEDEPAFCYPGLNIEFSDGITLYRTDIPDFPIFKAPATGVREYKESHGEALSKTWSTDKATFQNDRYTLVTTSKTLSLGGFEVKKDSHVLQFKDGGTLLVTREVSASTSDSKSKASCTYKKQ